MATCTFFGHRDCLDTIKPKLREVLINLITQQGVDLFYVGNQGQFDGIVRSLLRELSGAFSEVRYAVVLAYMPEMRSLYEDHSDTMLPEGIETVHPRYAVSWRNRWMLDRSDYVITYITHPWGGAAQFESLAKKQGKTVINIAQCGQEGEKR